MKDAPLYIHEDLIKKRFGHPGEFDDVARSAIAAAEHARNAVQVIKTTHAKIMDNPLATNLANQKRSRDISWRHADSALKRLQAAIERCTAEAEQLQTSMAPTPPRDAMKAIAYSDIRRGLAALSPNNRAAMLRDAVRDEEQDIFYAICAAPPIASGMSRDEAHLLRESWNSQHHREKLLRIKQLNEAASDLQKMGEGLMFWTGALTDGEAIRRAEKAQTGIDG